jgi:hypothetical protein
MRGDPGYSRLMLQAAAGAEGVPAWEGCRPLLPFSRAGPAA